MSYSSYSPSSPSPASTGCKYKRALLRGFRPSAQNQKLQCGVCPNRCIYCDIWKLATLIYSHVPAGLKSHSRPSSPSSYSSPSSSTQMSRSSSSASNSSSDDESGSKSIQAAFQTQRARLASILSICTVDGADECEGLRLAHDRCLISVTDLMNKERMLQERAAAVRHEYAAARLELEQQQQQRQSSVRRISRECASGSLRERYMDESRRASVVGMAR